MAHFIFDQPVRPRGTKKAKSRCMFILIPDKGYGQIHLSCFGNKGHYYQNGSCVHVEDVSAAMTSDWYRQRSWVLPFGDSSKEQIRSYDLRD